MQKVYKAVNTLVLVNKVQKAEQIASHLRRAGIAVQQKWVSSTSEFSAALQSEPFDLGIIFCSPDDLTLPPAIMRYPDLPFIVVVAQYRNRIAEVLLDQGASDVVGFSHPVRLKKVLTQTIAHSRLRQQNAVLERQFESQNKMLQSLLEGTQEAIAYLHQGMHSFGNPAYQKLTGLGSEAEVLSTPLLDLIDPSDRSRVDAAIRQLEQSEIDHAEILCQMVTEEGLLQTVSMCLTKSWFDGESVLQLIATRRAAKVITRTVTEAELTVLPEVQSSNTEHLLNAAQLQLNIEPINSLRADLFDRHFVSLQHASGPVDSAAELLRDDRSGMTLIDLDRCIILESINQLTQRLRRNPNSQFLIPLQADAAQHLGLTQWMQLHMQARSIPARAITLTLPLTGVSTFAEQFELTRQMQLAGIGVCIEGLSGTDEEQLYLSTSDIDYAILTPQIDLQETQTRLDQASYVKIQKQLQICQRAKVKTMIAASHPADIAALWKLGVDCLIGDLEAQLDTAVVC